ncbi:hypothetical protein B0H17DRAFT_1088052, partial [Mycena rosella]
MHSLLVVLLLRTTVFCWADDSFQHKIHGINVAHAQAEQSQRIQDLVALASSSLSTSGSTSRASISSSNSLTSNSASFTTDSATSSLAPSSSAHPTISATPFASADVSFQIYTDDLLPTNPAPPTSCASALTASVACNDTIQFLGSNPFYDGPSLAAMCSASCTSSLNTYRTNVVAACGNYQIPGPNNVSYAPTLAVDTISGPYAVQCRQDPTTSEFCNEILSSFGPTPAQGILGYPSNELCTPCMLGTMNATLSNPLTFYPDFYAVLQSALTTCGSAFVQYNVSTPPTATSFFSPGPSTTPIGSNDTVSSTCALTGRNITTTGTSTCADIASQFSVGWYDILDSNPTIQAANCTDGLGTGTKLCLPQACTTYTPTVNQTCEEIVAAANGILGSSNQSITVTQLVSFNPSLDTGCIHVGRQYGLSLCISPHGGFPDVGAVDNGAPQPVPTPTAIVAPPGQTPPGTTSNCGAWYFVQPGDFCTKVALNNSVTLDDFSALNPELNADFAAFPPLDSGGATSTIPAGTGVLSMLTVSLPSATPDAPFPYPTGHQPAPVNLAPDLSQMDATGTTPYEISDADFTLWNFNPTAPCPTLEPGTAVCVLVTNATEALPPTPTNAATGSAPSGCARWYTIASGDGCASLETKFALTQAELFALNPELAPATYTVQSGDNCNVIDSQFNISFSDFLHWNPEVSTTCNSMQPLSYCVGAPGGCESLYTVASGDSCGAIETKTGLSDAQLRALNPWIDTACSLQIGQTLCLKNSNVSAPPPGPPANLNPGSWSKCSGDNCNLIEAKFNIAFSDILRWNPEVSTTCSNLNLASYCVLGSGACSKIYAVVTGDSCGAVETKESISDTQLRAENTWINSACS